MSPKNIAINGRAVKKANQMKGGYWWIIVTLICHQVLRYTLASVRLVDWCGSTFSGILLLLWVLPRYHRVFLCQCCTSRRSIHEMSPCRDRDPSQESAWDNLLLGCRNIHRHQAREERFFEFFWKLWICKMHTWCTLDASDPCLSRIRTRASLYHRRCTSSRLKE